MKDMNKLWIINPTFLASIADYDEWISMDWMKKREKLRVRVRVAAMTRFEFLSDGVDY